jgi:hypothetical protein
LETISIHWPASSRTVPEQILKKLKLLWQAEHPAAPIIAQHAGGALMESGLDAALRRAGP